MLPAALEQSSVKPLLKGPLKFVSQWMIHVLNLCMLSRLVNDRHLLASLCISQSMTPLRLLPWRRCLLFQFQADCQQTALWLRSSYYVCCFQCVFWLLYTMFLHSTQNLASQGRPLGWKVMRASWNSEGTILSLLLDTEEGGETSTHAYFSHILKLGRTALP